MEIHRANRSKRRIVLVVVTALALAGGGISALMTGGTVSFEHPPQRFMVAHAQADGPSVTSGCAVCHVNPITESCGSCHDTPSTTVLADIEFPHHDPDEDKVTCNECHTAGNDARFVQTPVADHAFCQDCHGLEHEN